MKYILILIAFIFLILFVREMDFSTLLMHLKEAGWGVLGILVITGLAYLCASWSWLIITTKSFKIKGLSYFFVTRQISEAFATLNPAGILGGDALKVSMLNRIEKYRTKSLESVAVTRVLTLLSHIFLILCVLCFISVELVKGIGLSYLIGFLCVLFIVFYLLYQLFFSKKLWLYRSLKLLHRPDKKQERLNKVITRSRSFNYYSYHIRRFHPKVFYAATLLLMFHWILGAVEFILILKLLGVGISLSDGFIIEIGTSCVRSLVAFVPGQVGFDEYGNKFFLTLIGVSVPGIWIAVSVLKRMRQLFWIVVGAALYLIVSLKSIRSFNSFNILKGGSTVH